MSKCWPAEVLTIMENYKYITGKIHALDAVSQEISNLLEEKEQKNNVRSITKEV